MTTGYPPTPAFSKIKIDNYTIIAATHDSTLDLSGVFDYNGTVLSQTTSGNYFSTVIIDNQSIIADEPNDTLIIDTQGSITTSTNGNTVTIKLTAITCPVLQGLKGVDNDGNWVCAVI